MKPGKVNADIFLLFIQPRKIDFPLELGELPYLDVVSIILNINLRFGHLTYFSFHDLNLVQFYLC